MFATRFPLQVSSLLAFCHSSPVFSCMRKAIILPHHGPHARCTVCVPSIIFSCTFLYIYIPGISLELPFGFYIPRAFLCVSSVFNHTQSREFPTWVPGGFPPKFSLHSVWIPNVCLSVLPVMAYPGRLRPKVVPFSGFRIIKG